MPLLTSLLVLIVLARILGKFLERFDQPAIVGEMLAGVLLGPSVFNAIHADAALSGIAELAVFLVILSAGLEMNFKEVLDSLKGKGIVIALLSFFFPLLVGLMIGTAFDLDTMATFILALCISITALPVAVRILQSFNVLKSTIAKYSVATAIINDVAALLALGVILNLPAEKSFTAVSLSILTVSGKLIVLGAVILGFYRFLEKIVKRGIHVERIPEKIVKHLGDEALFGILIVFVLAFGSISEVLGFHFVIGAFFGALLIDRKFFLASRFRELEGTLGSVTNGFLAPVFFAYLGLEFDISAMTSIGLVICVLLVSVFTKVAAGWVGGRLIGLANTDSLGIGIILNGRGVMELVVASIAYKRGFIDQGLFSTLILMGVFTTIITPLMFRKWVASQLAPA